VHDPVYAHCSPHLLETQLPGRAARCTLGSLPGGMNAIKSRPATRPSTNNEVLAGPAILSYPRVLHAEYCRLEDDLC
jgi:hypothetical protein